MSVWNITAFNGYVPITTFWNDFEIAEAFGKDAVSETYYSALHSLGDDPAYLTELALVLNHRLWMHYERGNESLAKLYDKLWRAADQYAVEHLKGDALRYYLEVTD